MELAEKLKSIKIEGNVSLDQHLKEILRKMIENDEANPFETFEEYSEVIRRERGKKQKYGGKRKLMFDKADEMKDVCESLRKFLKILP